MTVLCLPNSLSINPTTVGGGAYFKGRFACHRTVVNLRAGVPHLQEKHPQDPTVSLCLGSWGGCMGVGALLWARYPWTACHSPCPVSTPPAMIKKDSPCTVYTNPDSYSASRNHPPLCPLHRHIARTFPTGASADLHLCPCTALRRDSLPPIPK